VSVELEAKSLLDDAGFAGPPGVSYAYDDTDPSVQLVALSDIEPPQRRDGVRYFVPDRANAVICGMINGDQMPPIGVKAPASSGGEFRYALYDGLHRYYLSMAAGYSHIPVEIVDAEAIRAVMAGER
jgi:hypothetical protein